MQSTIPCGPRETDLRVLSVKETQDVGGGFWWIFPIITGIGAGLIYCDLDGTLDRGGKGGSAPGDYPTGPKNTG
jgi:hypothetical protein